MFKETPKKIISLQNPLIKYLVKLRTDPRYRKEQEAVVVSGYKLVSELSETIPPKRIFSLSPHPQHIHVSEAVIKKITGLTSPEGIAAEFPLPLPTSLEKKAPLLALDRINDPGNMGTLIRTALALGWAGIYFLPGCVDPFHEKVIRASRGALFRLPWKEGDWAELKKVPLAAYTGDIEGRPLNEIMPRKEMILLLSNEAQGPSEEGLSFGERITIPMRGAIESLNVSTAGAIMMYELSRYPRE
ncbi:MAG: RNA methyltransferase [Chlamydiales bacterium]|nr:RNA methyltransferase [Chlamydiales bacterium]